MPNRFMAFVATLVTAAIIACHSPAAFAGATGSAAPVVAAHSEQSTQPTTEVGPERGAPLDAEQLADLRARERKNGNAEDFDGGVAIYIGGGVLLVALVLVAIIAVAD